MCKLITVLLLILTVVPGASCAGLSSEGAQRDPIVSAITMTEETSQGGTAGIRTVSPEEFSGRINKMINKVYEAASPIADSVAVIVLSVAGIALLFVLFGGMPLLTRVLGSVLSVVFGLLLYYGAPYIAGLVKGLN